MIIKKLELSGYKAPECYVITQENGLPVFPTASNAQLMWTKKKEAQTILDAIKDQGLEYVDEKLKYTRIK